MEFGILEPSDFDLPGLTFFYSQCADKSSPAIPFSFIPSIFSGSMAGIKQAKYLLPVLQTIRLKRIG